MDKYLLTLLVTFEQEYAIQKLFGRHGWEYSKMDKPKEDFISTSTKNETTSEIEKDLTGNAVRKKSVTGETSQKTAAETDTAHKVLTNPEKKSHLKGLSTISKDTRKNPVVVMDRVFDDVKKLNDSGNGGKIDDTGNVALGDSGNVGDLGNVGKSESGEEDDVEDYEGDTDSEEGNLDELGITVKIETHSDVDDHLVEEAASSPPVKRTGRGKIVQTALKRPAADKTSIVKRSKRRRTAGEDTNVTNKVNVDIKVEDVETEDPLQFLETLPDVKLFSESVNSEIDDIETFLSGPDDVNESGYSAKFSAYFCKDCHYTFPEETYYSVHKREGKCVFPCPYCNEKFTFRNYSKFREHQKKHTKSNSAMNVKLCKYCGKSFRSTSGLRDHERSHSGKATYICCGQMYFSKANLTRHRADNDFDASDELAQEGSFVEVEGTQTHQHKCSVCAKTFQTKYNLLRHARIHFANSVYCNKCLAAFESETALQEHVSIKHPKSHFICEDCGHFSYSKQCLEKHRILKHNEENKKKIVCPYDGCGRVFVESSKLDGHINIHLNMKPYECEKPGCKKTFASRFVRNRHTKMCGANNQQVVSCSECGKLFSNSHNLAIHTQAVHDQKSFVCGCGKSFRYITGLCKHKKQQQH